MAWSLRCCEVTIIYTLYHARRLKGSNPFLHFSKSYFSAPRFAVVLDFFFQKKAFNTRCRPTIQFQLSTRKILITPFISDTVKYYLPVSGFSIISSGPISILNPVNGPLGMRHHSKNISIQIADSCNSKTCLC